MLEVGTKVYFITGWNPLNVGEMAPGTIVGVQIVHRYCEQMFRNVLPVTRGQVEDFSEVEAELGNNYFTRSTTESGLEIPDDAVIGVAPGIQVVYQVKVGPEVDLKAVTKRIKKYQRDHGMSYCLVEEAYPVQ